MQEILSDMLTDQIQKINVSYFPVLEC